MIRSDHVEATAVARYPALVPIEQTTISGGLFHADVDGGRAACTITVLATSLRAETRVGQVFELPLRDMQVEVGGASGKMLFCRPPARDLTIFSEDSKLPEAMKLVAPGPLLNQLEAVLARASRKRIFGMTAALGVLAVIIVAILAAPAILRWTVVSVVDELPYEVDEKIGEMSFDEGELGGPIVEDEVVVEAAELILERLRLPGRDLAPDLPIRYDVRVVHSDQLNAFALPGGHVVLYTGLIAAADRPEQVAGVLAHEMSHVIRRHGLQRVAQSLGVIAAMQLLFGDAGGLVGAGRDLLTIVAVNDYSQEQESQADTDAVAMMLGAQLDPRALAELFAIMKEESSELEDALGAIPWLGTHPELEGRIAEVHRKVGSVDVEVAPMKIDWAKAKAAVEALGDAPDSDDEE